MGRREEEGRERRGGAGERGGVGEGRDGCGGGGGEGDGEGDISDAGMHPGAIGGSGPPPDAPMSSGDPSLRVRRRPYDLLLATSAGAAGQAHRPTPGIGKGWEWGKGARRAERARGR